MRTGPHVQLLISRSQDGLSRFSCIISRSSTEAEYREMADTLSELLWFREILPEMGIICNAPIVLHSDSFSAINLAANPIHHVVPTIVISFVTKSFEVQMLQNMYRLNLNLQTS